MNSALRKRHKIMWLLIALTLPALTVLAVVNIPDFPTYNKNPLNTKNSTPAKGIVLSEQENEFIKVNVRGNETKVAQLEIILKTPIKSASAVIYDANNKVLGQLGSTGVYRFDINKRPVQITIKDNIKNVEITKMGFSQ